MKKLFIILFFLPLSISAQDYVYENLYLPLNEGRIRYIEVVEVPGKSKSEIFKNAKVWFANNFRSAKDVINFQDEDSGIVSGRGNTSLYLQSLGVPVERILYYSIKIEAKDGRFRYTIDEIEISSIGLETTPIEIEFSKEYMYSKKGKQKGFSWKWYDQYEQKIIDLESRLKNDLMKNQDDW